MACYISTSVICILRTIIVIAFVMKDYFYVPTNIFLVTMLRCDITLPTIITLLKKTCHKQPLRLTRRTLQPPTLQQSLSSLFPETSRYFTCCLRVVVTVPVYRRRPISTPSGWQRVAQPSICRNKLVVVEVSKNCRDG